MSNETTMYVCISRICRRRLRVKVTSSVSAQSTGSISIPGAVTSSIMTRRPDPQFLEILTNYDRTVADLALALREIVIEEAPNAVEKIYEKPLCATLHSRGYGSSKRHQQMKSCSAMHWRGERCARPY
jgi:hypothetical protein